MKKILSALVILAIIITGCGAPKAEVPKVRESDGLLIQASATIQSVYLTLKYFDDKSLLYLSDSFDIDTAGKEVTFNDFNPGLETFPKNVTLSKFLSNYYGEIAKGITYKRCYELIEEENNAINQRFDAVFGKNTTEKPWSDDMVKFAQYCLLEVVKTIIDGDNYNKIARMYQGNEYEDSSNKRSRLSRSYRLYLQEFIFFDPVFKAKIDVTIDDAKTKGDGVYYEKIYDMLVGYLDDLRNKVKEGPYRDFVK